MNRTIQQTYTIPGALAANHIFSFKAHADLTIQHVSMVNTSANAGTLKIGTASDDDAHLEATNFGVSSTPTEAVRSHFVGGQYPRISKGEVVKLTITDHASHMANVCVTLTLAEG
jgi:hypothetical protein